MLRRLRVQNYKSILDDTIELGRINVFIGENGCGKTNLLEAVAMAGAALSHTLEAEELFNRGIRLAMPSLMTSAFADQTPQAAMEIEVTGADVKPLALVIEPGSKSSRPRPWQVRSPQAPELRPPEVLTALASELERLQQLVAAATARLADRDGPEEIVKIEGLIQRAAHLHARLDASATYLNSLSDFVIYNINALALRGLSNSSLKEPLGINGEGLDVAIAGLGEEHRRALIERASCVSWMEDIVLDAGDRLKLLGFKPARSTSRLYFVDRFLTEDHFFSAENANEGILHILFYLVLFVHPETPKLFGIDNLETALNPQLCRDLMKHLAELAQEHGRQALITTHNPAILDGLNLHDDEQRLFVVERNDEGHTKARRIRLKPDAGDGQTYKLSELWMRGYLGGLPRGF